MNRRTLGAWQIVIVSLLMLSGVAASSKPTCEDVVLPTRLRVQRGACRPIEITGSYWSCKYASARVSDLINQIIREDVLKHAEGVEASKVKPARPLKDCDPVYDEEVSCGKPYVTSRIVSAQCVSLWTSVHPESEAWAINLDTSGARPRRLQLADLLVAPNKGEKFWHLVRDQVRANILSACKEEPGDSDGLEESLAKVEHLATAITLSRAGITVGVDHRAFGHCLIEVTVPYSKLRGVIAEKYRE